MNLEEICKNHLLQISSYEHMESAASFQEFPFALTSHQFLAFANKDLESNGEHGLVNALTNAKRAIDCQVDAILNTFGIKKKRSFPAKMEQFAELGMIAPRILNRIIRLRNYLEHEYVLPDQERVEDAVDTATLFIAVTDRVYRMFTNYISIGRDDNHEDLDVALSVRYEIGQQEIQLCVQVNFEEVFNQTYDPSQAEYMPTIKLLMEIDYQYSSISEVQAVQNFVAIVLGK
ncbi:hypothetical protein ACVU7V_004401 [Vibrio vulnificus]